MSSTPDQPGPARQPAGGPSVTAVVLAWQAEPWLPRCVEALLASEKVSVEVVLVDNGCTTDDVEILARRPGVTVVRPSRNLGFSGGCNAGAAAATGEFLALVNSDAVVEPGTLARLVEEVSRPGVGIAVASIRLADDPALLNAGANPIHVLGLSWSGGMGEREERTEPVDTAGASGACLLTTLAHWQRLGGFDEEYFAYHEDAELSVRTWRLGLRVVYVPDAVAVHRYEFSRNDLKMYLAERNRLLFVATLWGIRARLLLAPAFAGLELAWLVRAALEGWLPAKLRGWRWLWTHRRYVRERRAALRAEQRVPDREWMRVLTPRMDTAVVPLPAVVTPVNAVMSAYWRLVSRCAPGLRPGAQRAFQALDQVHRGLPAQHLSRTAGVDHHGPQVAQPGRHERRLVPVPGQVRHGAMELQVGDLDTGADVQPMPVGHRVAGPHEGLDRVVDVQVVADVPAVAEEPGGLPGEHGGAEDCDHPCLAVRVLARPVRVGEHQRGARQPVQLLVLALVQLAGQLADRVRRERVGRGVLVHRKLRGRTVDGHRRGHHHLAGAGLAGRLQHGHRAEDVAPGIADRVYHADPHVDLRGQVEDDLRLGLREHLGEPRCGDVVTDQPRTGVQRRGQVRLPVVLQVVHDRHVVPVGDQSVGQVRADETRPAGDHGAHSRPFSGRNRSVRRGLLA